MGIRQLRQEYKPIPYSRKDEAGNHIPRDKKADEAANLLGEKIWQETYRRGETHGKHQQRQNNRPDDRDIHRMGDHGGSQSSDKQT